MLLLAAGVSLCTDVDTHGLSLVARWCWGGWEGAAKASAGVRGAQVTRPSLHRRRPVRVRCGADLRVTEVTIATRLECMAGHGVSDHECGPQTVQTGDHGRHRAYACLS